MPEQREHIYSSMHASKLTAFIIDGHTAESFQYTMSSELPQRQDTNQQTIMHYAVQPI